MSGDLLADNAVVCPNCGALNPPGTVVCRSCGVNVPTYKAAKGRLRGFIGGNAATGGAAPRAGVAELAARAVAQARRELATPLRLLLVVAAVVAAAIVVGTLLRAQYLEQRRAELAAQYGAALACLDREEYLCARTGLAALLCEAPDYPGARTALAEARRGLAEQYAQAGRFREAIAELDALLEDDPGNRSALAAVEDLYDRWRADAVARGDWWTAFLVGQQRRARFPPPSRDRPAPGGQPPDRSL